MFSVPTVYADTAKARNALRFEHIAEAFRTAEGQLKAAIHRLEAQREMYEQTPSALSRGQVSNLVQHGGFAMDEIMSAVDYAEKELLRMAVLSASFEPVEEW